MSGDMCGGGVGSNVVSGEVAGAVVQAGVVQGGVHIHQPSERLVVPRQLPSAVRDFTGRVEQLAVLDALLPAESGSGTDSAGAVVISVLDGTAGVGKTTLAVQWAHRVQHRFPDGTLFANLRGYGPSEPVKPGQVLGGFLLALGVPEKRIPADPEPQTGLYRSLLAGRRVLIVLDNAGAANQVRPLLPGAPGCLVLVTSRANLSGLVIADGAIRVTLDLLTAAEALELVRGIIGRARVEAEPDAVADLVGVCVRLPLALRVAASRIAARGHTSVAEVVEEVTDDQQRVDALSGESDEHTAVRTVFGWSYALLSPEQARMFRRLGLHPGPGFSVHAAAAVAGVDLATARWLLESLADTHLVEPVGPRRFRFHDLLRAYAADQARHEDTPADRDRAVHDLLTWYAQAADTADRLVFPTLARLDMEFEPTALPIRVADRPQALAWLNTEHANLFAALRRAAADQLHRLVIALAASVRFLFLRGQRSWTEQLDAESLGLAAAQASGDRAAEALLVMRRGSTHRNLGHWAEADADYEHQLALARELNDVALHAEALSGLGRNRLLQHRYTEAWDYYHAALPLTRSAGNSRAEAVVESNLSEICTKLGRYEHAVDHAERQLTLRRQAGDAMGEAMALYDAAVAWQGLDDHATAIALCRNAIALYRGLGHEGLSLALPFEAMATSLEHTGDLTQAVQELREAATILVEFGDPRAETLHNRLHDLQSRAATRNQ